MERTHRPQAIRNMGVLEFDFNLEFILIGIIKEVLLSIKTPSICNFCSSFLSVPFSLAPFLSSRAFLVINFGLLFGSLLEL